MAAPIENGSSHLVDQMEKAFQNCFTALTNQEHLNTGDSDESRTVVDQAIQRFMETAKETENFFLQKRLQLSVHKPEQVVKEDINMLKAELQRKDELLQKHHAKLVQWQALLAQTTGGQVPTAAPPGTTHMPPGVPGLVPPPVSQPVPSQQQAHYGQGPLHYLQQTTSNIGLPERR